MLAISVKRGGYVKLVSPEGKFLAKIRLREIRGQNRAKLEMEMVQEVIIIRDTLLEDPLFDLQRFLRERRERMEHNATERSSMP